MSGITSSSYETNYFLSYSAESFFPSSSSISLISESMIFLFIESSYKVLETMVKVGFKVFSSESSECDILSFDLKFTSFCWLNMLNVLSSSFAFSEIISSSFKRSFYFGSSFFGVSWKLCFFEEFYFIGKSKRKLKGLFLIS